VVEDERGQALTLEAITAAIILLASIGFALQVTAVTPLSASTSSQHLENQLQLTGEGVLSSAADNGDLEEAVTYWNTTNDEFHNASDPRYYQSPVEMNTSFGDSLIRTYGERNIAYNVLIHYYNENGNRLTQTMIDSGAPSDHAVSSSRTIELVDDDHIVEQNFSSGPALSETTDFYIPDSEPDGPHYNLVRVEVISWRI